jgi:hypothetical protein
MGRALRLSHRLASSAEDVEAARPMLKARLNWAMAETDRLMGHLLIMTATADQRP